MSVLAIEKKKSVQRHKKKSNIVPYPKLNCQLFFVLRRQNSNHPDDCREAHDTPYHDEASEPNPDRLPLSHLRHRDLLPKVPLRPLNRSRRCHRFHMGRSRYRHGRRKERCRKPERSRLNCRQVRGDGYGPADGEQENQDRKDDNKQTPAMGYLQGREGCCWGPGELCGGRMERCTEKAHVHCCGGNGGQEVFQETKKRPKNFRSLK
ncbi:hypothetical protein BJ742DRAFT_310430 [Cladochytrium replicatum]|nr:hypothetical protein BJ742DRAFT_310430 [Cladochytrium replicatum]